MSKPSFVVSFKNFWTGHQLLRNLFRVTLGYSGGKTVTILILFQKLQSYFQNYQIKHKVNQFVSKRQFDACIFPITAQNFRNFLVSDYFTVYFIYVEKRCFFKSFHGGIWGLLNSFEKVVVICRSLEDNETFSFLRTHIPIESESEHGLCRNNR